MNDDSLMPFGQHKDKKLANVPAQYLLWCLTLDKLRPDLRKYIEDNKADLQSESKSIRNQNRYSSYGKSSNGNS